MKYVVVLISLLLSPSPAFSSWNSVMGYYNNAAVVVGGDDLYDARVVFSDSAQDGSNFKVCVHDASVSFALVACTAAGTVAQNATQTATFSSGTLINAHNYHVSYISDGYTYVQADNTIGNMFYDDTGSYASPPDPVTTTNWARIGRLCVEVRNSTGTVLLGNACAGNSAEYLNSATLYGNQSAYAY